ncbi:MAG: protein kinase [Lentisphaerae bacterium]|nr:protein kinase [Lentisphaerota bacterium]MCP4102685.1 protein kinase [Lentisphaerota bacterium]
MAEALDCAWKEQKLIHRDIKPDNIMLTKNGRAKLADLGLSKVAGDTEDEDEDEIMGTPQYSLIL